MEMYGYSSPQIRQAEPKIRADRIAIERASLGIVEPLTALPLERLTTDKIKSWHSGPASAVYVRCRWSAIMTSAWREERKAQ